MEPKEEAPWVAFGNDELAKLPVICAGEKIKCPHCGQLHELIQGQDDRGNDTDIILFYECGD
ncbi:MAG: hypothetical protein ACOY58_07205, partial [Candidatus Micrarchaeota archaeon]